MKVVTYERAMYLWKNGYRYWNHKKYSYFKKNFYIGLYFLENDKKMNVFYCDTDHDLEDRSVINRDIMGSFNSPGYSYYIKISSKETIDNITEYDYNKIIMDFEYKIKQCKIKKKIDSISKDFE